LRRGIRAAVYEHSGLRREASSTAAETLANRWTGLMAILLSCPFSWGSPPASEGAPEKRRPGCEEEIRAASKNNVQTSSQPFG
jgi:hypothetical protein